MSRGCILGLLLAGFCSGQNRDRTDLKALYESQQWHELYEALNGTRGYDFYRGAVAVVYHQNPERAETYLRSAIQAAPKSEKAHQAYEWLSHLFLYTGQYRRAVSAMDARWAAFPDRPERAQEQAAISAFRGLPDQVTEHVQASTLPHEKNSIFIPVSINGFDEQFFFDTGAWVCSTSESEAKRLALKFTDATGTVATMTNRAGFRTAVAKTLEVGNVRLKNVAFFVFPDDGEPWSALPPGRKGLLGMPVILAFRTLLWERSGAVRIGGIPAPFDASRANLMFDNDHLALSVGFEGHSALAAVDTGAQGTDLYREFGTKFRSMLARGTKGTTQVRGAGGAESYESVTLPEVAFDIAGQRAVLYKADVLMNRGIRSFIGNFGMDLFKQGRALRLDFSAMRLELEGNQ